MDWPVVAVHAALLPNGKVLAYDSVGDNATETYPDQDFSGDGVGSQRDSWTRHVDTGYNIFCWGLAHLAGRPVFLAGGNKDQPLDGIVQTTGSTRRRTRWWLGPNMAAGRWYPTATPLRNGEMLITRGASTPPRCAR